VRWRAGTGVLSHAGGESGRPVPPTTQDADFVPGSGVVPEPVHQLVCRLAHLRGRPLARNPAARLRRWPRVRTPPRGSLGTRRSRPGGNGPPWAFPPWDRVWVRALYAGSLGRRSTPGVPRTALLSVSWGLPPPCDSIVQR
jgi:hypothetical protein